MTKLQELIQVHNNNRNYSSNTAYRGVEYNIQDRANKQSERKYLSTTYRGIQTQTQVEVVKWKQPL